MPPDLIAALSPPAAPPGSTAASGGAAALIGSPHAALFASLLAATESPALAVSPAAVTIPPMHTTPVLSKISFSPVSVSPISVSPGKDLTEPVAPTPKKPALWETEHLEPAAAAVPSLLPLSTTPPTVQSANPAEVTAKDAKPEGAEDAKTDTKKDTKKDSLKKLVDTSLALVPNGELVLSPPPPVIFAASALPPAMPPAPAPSAAGHAAAPAVPQAVGAGVSLPAARLTPEAAPAPSVQNVSMPQAVPVPWTPPTDAPAAPVPSASPAAPSTVANTVTSAATPAGVGDSLPPVFPARADTNSVPKPPQKDLKMTGVSADTITRTQTELPRLTRLNRKEPPTEAVSTEESRMEARGDTGQGLAPAFTLAPALHTELQTGIVAAETKALTHTEKLEIVQQLADGAGSLRLAAKPGATQEMTVQLHPKDWGSLHVTVQIAPSTDAQAVQNPARGDAPKDNVPKTVTAQIVAETPQVKAALESHTGELHQKLREAGLHLDSVTVTVRVPEAAHSSSGTTSQGSHTDTQGRFQDGTQGSPNGGTQANTLGQGGTQGSDFGQRLTDFSGRQDGSADSSAGPALSGGGASGSQNNSQGGRQGSQTPHETLRWMGTEPDADAAPRWTASRHSGAARLDLRA